MEYVTKEDHKEDLKTDRRVTRAEADIVHTNEKVKAVDTDVQNQKVQIRTEFRFIAALLVSIAVGLFYFIHHVNMEMHRQFGELRSDVADNRQLIEANSTQLVSLRSEVEETNKRIDEVNDRIDGMSDRIDEVNDRLDNVDDRLAVVENVLSIDHQTSTYHKTGKL